MARDIQSEGSKALDQVEHNSDASAKRVVIRAQDPSTGNWYNISASPNGDGTFGLSSSSGAILLSKIDTTSTANVTYIGKAVPGSASSSAVWQIKKLDTSTLALDKKWADSGAFTQVWNDRATTVVYS